MAAVLQQSGQLKSRYLQTIFLNNNMDKDMLKQAKEEIEAICKKYAIELIPVVIHQGNRTASSIEIVPISDFQENEGII
jgi:hypothetical protein